MPAFFQDTQLFTSVKMLIISFKIPERSEGAEKF
jgi:hypothetical protein